MSPRRISPASILRLLGPWRGERTGPAYSQLADSLRLLILDGRLALDVVLPGERELAAALEVSRTTVTAAMARRFLESGASTDGDADNFIVRIKDSCWYVIEEEEF